MSTETIPTTPGTATRHVELPNIGKLLLQIGRGLLVLVLLLLTLILIVPVPLLFAVTSAPPLPAIMLALADLGLVAASFRFKRTWKTVGAAFVGFIVVALMAIWLSQTTASTPPITDADGNPIPGSIASLETVTLGGSEQWITIRGYDQTNPVLLFLAGGPGGSELAMTRKYLGELEKHFIIVNWDQPGTGKSYRAADFDTITPEDYVADGYELTQYLCERFDQDKIYLFGESWGSILGVWLVQEYPELYHAFVSTGQMVAPVENDIQMYEFAIERLIEQGRMDDVEQLRRNGPPPYDKGELLRKFQTINAPVNSYMESHAHGEETGHNLAFDSLKAQEYGLLDKGYWFLGLARTFTTVYPQIYDVDFRTQATKLEVPVYFIKGRWDINASNSLLEEYFAILEAPHKELIWFEHSAHTPSWDEPEHFVDVMVNTVLAQTQSAIADGHH
jgi:pimeloyl-ACP methyl ester carboxylesterase